MYRKWSARRQSTLDISAIDTGTFSKAYVLDRATLEPAAALRLVLQLLTAFTFLWLPVHCGICWVSTYSLALAGTAVGITAAALLSVALAKWLALDEVLQKLPLLLILALVGVAFVFFSSQPLSRWGWGGLDFYGALFIIIVLVSIAGNLYRPVSAAYQTVTLKTRFRDLCVAAAAMLLSLGIVAVAHSLPRFGMDILTCTLAGGYAGLVVTEYAAWARANPKQSLERTMSFGKLGRDAKGKPRDVIGSRGATFGAALFGLAAGLFSAVLENIQSPTSEFCRFVFVLAEKDTEKVRDVIGVMVLLSIVGMFFGLILTGSSLSGLRPGNPFLSLRLAGQAIALFLTYPETTHPLIHRLHIPWLRPVSVRMALTGLILITVATATYAPVERPREERAKEESDRPLPPPMTTPPTPRFALPEDEKIGRANGLQQDLWPAPVFPPVPEPVKPEPLVTPSIEARGGKLLSLLFGLVFGPPLFLFVMVWFVGITVLPTYFRYFESAAP